MAGDGLLSVGRSREREQVHVRAALAWPVRASDLRSAHAREHVVATKSGSITIRVHKLGARSRDSTQAGARDARILVDFSIVEGTILFTFRKVPLEGYE